MENRKQEITAFFDRYEKRFRQSLEGKAVNVEATAASFADCFVEASPLGVVCAKNNAKFRRMIPKGSKFYRTIGITAMDILGSDITLLDDLHAMAKIHWRSSYLRKDGVKGAIEFDVIYLLQTLNDSIKIFAYITGDEQKALREHGLVEG